MSDDKSCSRNTGSSLAGAIWIIGWFFTIGFAKLVWWKALLAVLFWGYYLGVALKPG